jgi:hypothetical protein
MFTLFLPSFHSSYIEERRGSRLRNGSSGTPENLRYSKSTLLAFWTSQISSRIEKTSLYLVFAATGMV